MTDCMITRIRKTHRLTQEQFASLCGVSKSIISSMEQGNRIGNASQRLILLACIKLLDKSGPDTATKKSTDSI
jgi:transcriptional regulator with XRE-family HTH domain